MDVSPFKLDFAKYTLWPKSGHKVSDMFRLSSVLHVKRFDLYCTLLDSNTSNILYSFINTELSTLRERLHYIYRR